MLPPDLVYAWLGVLLFLIGLACLLTQRNVIKQVKNYRITVLEYLWENTNIPFPYVRKISSRVISCS